MTKHPGSVQIAVTNPTPYERGGAVAVPWREIAAVAPRLDPRNVEVVYDGGVVPSQVDNVEGTDASRVLLISLARVPGGDEHYRKPTLAVVVRERREAGSFPDAALVQDTANGLRLEGSVLDVWISVDACPWNDNRTWFAGAASTIQVRKREFLDVNPRFGWEGHDPEKRAMQVDRVRIWRPPWDDHEPSYCDFPLHDRDFEIIAHGAGPVRGWCTIASAPFRFEFRDLTSEKRRAYNCRLYRSISLFADSDLLLDELHVKATLENHGAPATLAFSARYFMSAHLGLLPEIRRVPRIPDWFAVGSDMPPHPGYGFATDAHASTCSNPPAFYPRPDDQLHKGYEWETGAARSIKSLHLFRLHVTPDEIADAAGKAWYLHLLKPLRARVVGEWAGERA